MTLMYGIGIEYIRNKGRPKECVFYNADDFDWMGILIEGRAAAFLHKFIFAIYILQPSPVIEGIILR